jgi:signal transduction histidine kinase
MDSESDFERRLLREKLASLKEFAYGASHELNNPLFNISSRAQLLLRDETDPERRRKLATIYAHAMRASDMIKDMALAAHPPKPEMAEANLSAIVADVVAELAPAAVSDGVRLTACADGEQEIVIHGDATQLAVAIREICINACEALRRSHRAGEVVVSLTTSGERVEIGVRDNGPGLDARARRHLFDPFFSGYESGRGLGFGLTKCWQIVDAHRGEIVVESSPSEGTSIVICLPHGDR